MSEMSEESEYESPPPSPDYAPGSPSIDSGYMTDRSIDYAAAEREQEIIVRNQYIQSMNQEIRNLMEIQEQTWQDFNVLQETYFSYHSSTDGTTTPPPRGISQVRNPHEKRVIYEKRKQLLHELRSRRILLNTKRQERYDFFLDLQHNNQYSGPMPPAAGGSRTRRSQVVPPTRRRPRRRKTTKRKRKSRKRTHKKKKTRKHKAR